MEHGATLGRDGAQAVASAARPPPAPPWWIESLPWGIESSYRAHAEYRPAREPRSMLAHESADPPRTGMLHRPPARLHQAPAPPRRASSADGR
ncbi:hypothetical protein [Streptomyces wuyuanensis]|uniref:hypothetical protein n=1 Tax=Streptomyces wuyuanensis TaxID=1196353 RepID=UPI00341AF8FE